MQTENRIIISRDPDLVFATAADILDWPRILPHYRWVRHIGGSRDWRIYEMAAWRSCIPIRWVSLTQVDPAARRIYFRHVGGLTRGMEVEWRVDGLVGGTEVVILHELSRMKVPVVRTKLGKLITGHVFVKHVADRTLKYMKRWLEQRCEER